MCLHGLVDIVENPMWGLQSLPTRDLFSQSLRIPYMGLDMKTELFSLLWVLGIRFLCLGTLPLSHLTFELQLPWPWLACLSLLATVPKLGIRWRRTWSWTRASNSKPACLSKERVMKTWKRNEIGGTWSDYLDNTLIDRTKCSANNFLDVVNGIEYVTDAKQRVMKLNEG
jgi:hypothetical protein